MKVLAIVLISVGCSTTIGVLGGLAVRALPHKWNDVVLGFSAGVLLVLVLQNLL